MWLVDQQHTTQVSPGIHSMSSTDATSSGTGLYAVANDIAIDPNSPLLVWLQALDDTDLELIATGKGAGWYLLRGGLDGWDDLAELKGSSESWALEHGDAEILSLLRQGTSGTLRLRFRGLRAEVAAANARVNGLFARPLLMAVQDHDGVLRSRRVRIHATQAIDRHGPDHILTVSAVWHAADPRRYGVAVDKLAGAAVTNHGTAPTSPVLRIKGPFAATTITEQETGRVVRWQGSVSSTETLILDPALGVGTINGEPRMGLRQFEWPLIPAGEARTYTASAGVLTIEHRSAWW